MARDIGAGRAERVVSGGVSRGPQARYLPIAEHGLIGDLHTVALVGTDGTIETFEKYAAAYFDKFPGVWRHYHREPSAAAAP